MSSEKHCCVPGCKEKEGTRQVLHRFPNPEKDISRFRAWLYAIGGDILALKNENIYKRRRVCHLHFEDKYLCRYNKISNIAVPTINLPGVHRFPNPHKFPEQFEAWVHIVGRKLETPDDYKAYQHKRICAIHFIKKDYNRNNRLNALAVPSQHLPAWCSVPQPLDNSSTSSSSNIQSLMATGKIDPPREDRNEQVTTDLSNVLKSQDSSPVFHKDDDEVSQEHFTDNAAPSPIDDEPILEQEARAIIAKVYHYLEKEYEYIKTIAGDSCDVSPLANTLKRTAEATGVKEDTVTAILEECQSIQDNLELPKTPSEEEGASNVIATYEIENVSSITDIISASSAVSCKEELGPKPPKLMKILKKRPTQSTVNHSQLPSTRLVKSHFITRSELTESDHTESEQTQNSNGTYKKHLCIWCNVRNKCYNKTVWMCEQCQVPLCLENCFKNYHTVP